MKILLILLGILSLLSCKQEKSGTISIDTTISQERENIIDSVDVSKKLAIKPPSYLIQIDDRQMRLPFHYSIKFSKKTYRGNYAINWKLCDLEINSDLSSHNVYSFEDDVPYKGYQTSEGELHIVKTEDATAVTIEKFKALNTDNYSKIYYSDSESIIYKTYADHIFVLYFKYNKKENAFYVFLQDNSLFGFEGSEEDLLDIATTQLRLAKNINDTSTKEDLLNWDSYKNSLHSVNKKVYKNIYSSILKSTDTIQPDIVFTPYIDGNFGLVSIFKAGEEGALLWDVINNITKTDKVDLEKSYKPSSSRSSMSNKIASLRSFSSGKYFFELEYKNDSSIILKKEIDFSRTIYAVFSKVMINNKEVILFTGNEASEGLVKSKEMAYFYMNLFENYSDL